MFGFRHKYTSRSKGWYFHTYSQRFLFFIPMKDITIKSRNSSAEKVILRFIDGLEV